MKMIVGLGNPGKKYETTRHNVGFILIDLLADKLGCQIEAAKFNGLVAEVFSAGQKVLLVKPQTYMNLSGQCVGELARYYKIENEDILVLVDDLSLPTGTMKLRPKGSSGGHNGLKSLIAHLDGDDFPRLKIGIGRSEEQGVIDHVLGHFPEPEWQVITAILEKAAACSLDWLAHGVYTAMCHYNMYAKLPAQSPPPEGKSCAKAPSTQADGSPATKAPGPQAEAGKDQGKKAGRNRPKALIPLIEHIMRKDKE